jgi:hypothetical protein
MYTATLISMSILCQVAHAGIYEDYGRLLSDVYENDTNTTLRATPVTISSLPTPLPTPPPTSAPTAAATNETTTTLDDQSVASNAFLVQGALGVKLIALFACSVLTNRGWIQ